MLWIALSFLVFLLLSRFCHYLFGAAPAPPVARAAVDASFQPHQAELVSVQETIYKVDATIQVPEEDLKNHGLERLALEAASNIEILSEVIAANLIPAVRKYFTKANCKTFAILVSSTNRAVEASQLASTSLSNDEHKLPRLRQQISAAIALLDNAINHAAADLRAGPLLSAENVTRLRDNYNWRKSQQAALRRLDLELVKGGAALRNILLYFHSLGDALSNYQTTLRSPENPGVTSGCYRPDMSDMKAAFRQLARPLLNNSSPKQVGHFNEYVGLD